MRRLGMQPLYRQPGRSGANVYNPRDVRTAWAARGWTELERHDDDLAPPDDGADSDRRADPPR